MRDFRDIADRLSRPRYGSAETAASSWWRFIPQDAKIVTIRRPVQDVVDSLLAIEGVNFDKRALEKLIAAQDRKLDQIRARRPVLSIAFDELADEATCAAVFEHCLPYRHNHDHWSRLDAINVQIDMPAFFQGTDFAALAGLAAAAKQHSLRSMAWH